MSDDVIDRDKLRAGDRVLIRWKGLEGWQTMTERFFGTSTYLFFEPLRAALNHGDVRVLEHKPAPVKIEVELPQPGEYTLITMKVRSEKVWQRPMIRFSFPAGATGISVPVLDAEAFALAILALVHEARS